MQKRSQVERALRMKLGMPSWVHSTRNIILYCLYSAYDLFAAVHREPIFVLGHQKSGTTVIANLLALALGERYSHDMFYHRQYSKVSNVYSGGISITEIVRDIPNAFAAGVIKDPDLTLLLPSILTYFPKSKIIFIIRDPRANIGSVLERLGIPGDLQGLAAEQALARVNKTLWKEALSHNFSKHKSTHYIDILSNRWNYYNAFAFCKSSRLHVIMYEDFLIDKTKNIEHICSMIGRDIKNDISNKIDKSFQPKGTRATNHLEFYGHDNLSRINNICQPIMSKFGYE